MHRVAVILLAWVAVLLAGHAVAQSPGCVDGEAKRHGIAVDVARQALMMLPSGSELETDVPEPAQLGLIDLKARLGWFIAAYMACASAGASTAAIEHDLLLLSNAAWPKAAEDDARYGGHLEFKLRLLRAQPLLLGIVAAFGIQCGGDALLAIYAAGDAGWTEVLRYHSEPYDTVAGAFGWFDYGVSPPDERGHWYAVTRHVRPWCTSNWSMLHYEVLRPQPGGTTPRVLLESSEEIWWAEGEHPGDAALAADGFDLTFSAQSIDPHVFTRTWVRSFAVTGDTVRRRDPVALNARDFVDEWIQSDWLEAKAWLQDDAPSLQALHASFTGPHDLSFAGLRACSDAPGHVEVQLGDDEQARYYFHVIAHGVVFRLRAVTREADPTCDGPDQLEELALK